MTLRQLDKEAAVPAPEVKLERGSRIRIDFIDSSLTKITLGNPLGAIDRGEEGFVLGAGIGSSHVGMYLAKEATQRHSRLPFFVETASRAREQTNTMGILAGIVFGFIA